MFKDKLKSDQKVIYQTLLHAFESNKLSHAYLISGDKGSYLKEMAIYLAKSFLCTEDTLACESCSTCRRVENGSYIDFKFINSNCEGIKVEDIEELQEDFSMVALEPRGIKVYIIHLIETANLSAVNKLLKFLEEPSDNIYGIITTENLARVLPTIISRCQLLRLFNQNKDEMIKQLENQYSHEDSLILSKFNNSIDEVKETLDNTNYSTIKDMSIDTLDILTTNPKESVYYVQRNVETVLKEKNELKLFLEILAVEIRDLLLDRKDSICPSSIKNSNLNLEEVLSKIYLCIGSLDYNLNIPLLLDQLFYSIIKDKGE